MGGHQTRLIFTDYSEVFRRNVIRTVMTFKGRLITLRVERALAADFAIQDTWSRIEGAALRPGTIRLTRSRITDSWSSTGCIVAVDRRHCHPRSFYSRWTLASSRPVDIKTLAARRRVFRVLGLLSYVRITGKLTCCRMPLALLRTSTWVRSA